MKLASRVKNIKPSAGFELLKLAKKLKSEGKDIISLAIGELQWNTYQPLRQAAQKAIEEGWTKYSPSAGQESLRQLLSQQASQHWSIPLTPENIFIGNGCKAILFALFQTFCDPEDEVILPSPYWMSYPASIELSEAKVKVTPTQPENHFKITPKELEQAISQKTKFFILNSPNNPTGAIYSKKELKALGEVLNQHNSLFTIVDAIYDQLTYSQAKAPHLLEACPHLQDRVLALNGASKNYLMTGWRLGWLIAQKEIVKAVSTFQSQSLSCANTISQKAFEGGFLNCEEHIKDTVKKLKSIRDILTEGLKSVPGLKLFPSEGGFYLWLGVQNFLGKHHKGQKLNSSKDIMKHILTEKNLLCIPGEEFGSPGYLRLSYVAYEQDIKKALVRLKEFFSELK